MLSRGNGPGGRAGAALAACLLAGLLAVTACSGGGSGNNQPPWAKTLGSGVTVVPPGAATAGNDSPDGVMTGVVKAITKGPISDFCTYEQPSQQSQCNSTFSQVTKAEVASQLPSFKNFALGYTVIDGNKALIGTTGTICVPNQTPKCFTNHDPAAILKSGKKFAALWTESVAAPPNVYSLSPAIKINGNWYAYTSNS